MEAENNKSKTIISSEEEKKIRNVQSIEFDPQTLPSIITEQVDSLKDFEEKKKEAEKEAENAKKAADKAKNIQLKWYKSDKNAIENLQDACSQLSNAMKALVEAQEKAFQSQEKITKVSKFLLGLGLTNVASNRMVIRELEMRLKDASEEQIDELARQELENVVKQLKAQEDMQSRIEKHANALHEHDDKFVSIDESLKQQERNVTVLEEDIETLKKDTEQYVYNITQALENFSKMLKDERQNIEEQKILVQKHMEESESELEESVKSLAKQTNDWLHLEMDNIKKANHTYKIKLDNEFLKLGRDTSSQLSTVNHRINSLSHRIDIMSKKTFLDTSVYKILVGLFALFSFIISLCTLFEYNIL